jgi:predicted dehydrogenase
MWILDSNHFRPQERLMISSRREFLASAAAVGTLAMTGPAATRHPEDLRLGVIGVGWYGMVDAKAALRVGGVEVVAICDVDSQHLKKSADELEKVQGKRPNVFKLYEEMLDKSELDLVIIATPPHWHALQLIACLDRNLDVYCEKPLAYDIREGRAIVDAVKKSGRVVQIGFQRRQSSAFQQVGQRVAAGDFGRIVQADVQIHYKAGTKDPTPTDPPASLDWDLWCGPGPKIQYSPQVGHMNWRLEKTSGHGHLVDWGIHNIDATRMMLGLNAPRRITAAGGIYEYQGIITTPDTLTAHFEFEQLPVVWRHRLWGAQEYTPEINNGVILFGEEATVYVSDQKWVVIPKGKSSERQENQAASDMGTEHMANFIEAVRNQTPVHCPVEEGYQSTKTVQLGMIAYETNSVVSWDESGEQIHDHAEAAKLLKRDYREPWQHPYDG